MNSSLGLSSQFFHGPLLVPEDGSFMDSPLVSKTEVSWTHLLVPEVSFFIDVPLGPRKVFFSWTSKIDFLWFPGFRELFFQSKQVLKEIPLWYKEGCLCKNCLLETRGGTLKNCLLEPSRWFMKNLLSGDKRVVDEETVFRNQEGDPFENCYLKSWEVPIKVLW